MQVPLLDLKAQYKGLRDEIITTMDKLCDTQYFILGKTVEDFEKNVAEYSNSEYACGVSSGSDALLIVLMAEGIGAGDEVITTPFTFFATAGAISRVGATPVFVDVEPGSFNIYPKLIEDKVTSRTKAIIPVHLFGQMAEMDEIMDIAKRNNLIVIEDAAQAIGAEYKGRRAGSIGDYGCFSFFPSKNLGAFGDGGMVTTNTEDRLNMLKIFRNHGSDPKYYHKYIGGNFRLDAIQAAILQVKMKYLDQWSAKRQQNAVEYREIFSNSRISDKVVMPEESASANRHIYNQFSVLILDGARDKVKAALAKAGVGVEVYYPVPLHEQECFAPLGYKKGDMPVSEKVANEILAIPIYPETSREQREYIVSVMEKALQD